MKSAASEAKTNETELIEAFGKIIPSELPVEILLDADSITSRYLGVYKLRKNPNGSISAYGILTDDNGNPITERKRWYRLAPHRVEVLLEQCYGLLEEQ